KCVARHLCAELAQPHREPSSLDAGVSSYEDAAVPELIDHLVPDLPGRGARVPHRVKLLGLAISIHALPKTFVLIDRKLIARGKTREAPRLERVVVTLDQVEHAGLEDEETSVDPPRSDLRLFLEQRHGAVANGELA